MSKILKHSIAPDAPDWDKGNGLLPAIVQHTRTRDILMLGYMNRAALEQTQDSRLVTFFSRSKNRLWTKGESSGNTLTVESLTLDCDRDTILITAQPAGPVCHTGTATCFGDTPPDPALFLNELGAIIHARATADDPEDSYTARLLHEGRFRIAQKVGEEGVETALAAVKGDPDELRGEAADLLYHLLVLLEDAGLDLHAVCETLRERHAQRTE